MSVDDADRWGQTHVQRHGQQPADPLHVDVVENKLGVDRGACRVVLAEDSKFIHGIMKSVLLRCGYREVLSYYDGAQAWKALLATTQEDRVPTVVIADVEMPQMDGLALTRRLKENADLRDLPVILFSSIITDDTRHKGEEVGADEQISKPQLRNLVEIVDGWAQKVLATA